MKHKTWFRLVIKAIGVLLIGLSLPGCIAHLGGLALTITSGALSRFDTFYEYQIPYVAGLFIQSIVGLYLFFGGKWVVNKCIPSNRPYCPECGYDLSHTPSLANCPECGVVLPGRSGESSS